MNGYLLDTDHCIQILDGHSSIGPRLAAVRPFAVASCVFVEGELLYMALRSDRTEDNLRRVSAFLEDLAIYPADRESAQIYARLKKGIADQFGPRDKAKRRKFHIETLGLKENDIWIASLALQYDLTLLSADSDFERIAQIEGLRIENWRSPSS